MSLYGKLISVNEEVLFFKNKDDMENKIDKLKDEYGSDFQIISKSESKGIGGEKLYKLMYKAN